MNHFNHMLTEDVTIAVIDSKEEDGDFHSDNTKIRYKRIKYGVQL